MDVKDFVALIGLGISFAGIILTIRKLGKEQARLNELKAIEIDASTKRDQRSEYKLRVLHLLIDENLTFHDIVTKFREHTPMSEINEKDLRICLYEMLVEQTLVVFADGTYTVDTADEDEDGEEDEDGLF